MTEDYLDSIVGLIVANAIRWSSGDMSGKDFVDQTRGIILAVMKVSQNTPKVIE